MKWILALLISVSSAMAQQQVFTLPASRLTNNSSGTIAATGPFQEIWPLAVGRTGCTIQNNGSGTMYVYFGTMANATTSNSARLSVGQSLNCNVNGIILRDQVSISGTSGDAFYAVNQ